MRIGIMNSAYMSPLCESEGLAKMKAHGYDAMDYTYLATTELEIYSGSDEQFAARLGEIKRRIDDAGIEVFQTHGPWRWPVRDFTEEDRAERFEKMCKAIIATRILGAKYFVIHPMMPYGADKDPYPEEFWRFNREFLTRLTEVGRENDVIVCLENMPMKALSISTPSATLKMVKEIDSPYLRVCLDTGHAAVFGIKPGDAVRELGREYLACLHVHDNDGAHDLHRLPFAGVIDWEDFKSALAEIGYDGVLSLETDAAHMLRLPEELKEHYELALARTAAYLAGK